MSWLDWFKPIGYKEEYRELARSVASRAEHYSNIMDVYSVPLSNVTCRVCGLTNKIWQSDLSVYCAECCNLLEKGGRHNDYSDAAKDARKRCNEWAVRHHKGLAGKEKYWVDKDKANRIPGGKCLYCATPYEDDSGSCTKCGAPRE